MVRGKSNFLLTFQGKPGVTLLVKVVARELSNVFDTLSCLANSFLSKVKLKTVQKIVKNANF